MKQLTVVCKGGSGRALGPNSSASKAIMSFLQIPDAHTTWLERLVLVFLWLPAARDPVVIWPNLLPGPGEAEPQPYLRVALYLSSKATFSTSDEGNVPLALGPWGVELGLQNLLPSITTCNHLGVIGVRVPLHNQRYETCHLFPVNWMSLPTFLISPSCEIDEGDRFQ